MVARARRHDESYDKYRTNLKKEAIELKRRLKGTTGFSAVEFFTKMIDDVKQKMKRTKTYSADMKQVKKSRQVHRANKRAMLKAQRARG